MIMLVMQPCYMPIRMMQQQWRNDGMIPPGYELKKADAMEARLG